MKANVVWQFDKVGLWRPLAMKLKTTIPASTCDNSALNIRFKHKHKSIKAAAPHTSTPDHCCSLLSLKKIRVALFFINVLFVKHRKHAGRKFCVGSVTAICCTALSLCAAE